MTAPVLGLNMCLEIFGCYQEKIFEVYQSICFKPDQFNDYLMSVEVGFSNCELLGTPDHKSKGCHLCCYIHLIQLKFLINK